MKHSVLVATLLAAMALVPVAIHWDDLLVLSLAGLIPLIVDWRQGDLS